MASQPDEPKDAFQDLLTVVIDSRNGYEEALETSDDARMTTFFRSMLELKRRHVDELEGLLRERGVEPDEGGSFLTTVNKAIFNFKALFGGVDESVLPGLIDGEGRILEYYDNAIPSSANHERENHTLAKQRAELLQMINAMKAMKPG